MSEIKVFNVSFVKSILALCLNHISKEKKAVYMVTSSSIWTLVILTQEKHTVEWVDTINCDALVKRNQVGERMIQRKASGEGGDVEWRNEILATISRLPVVTTKG